MASISVASGHVAGRLSGEVSVIPLEDSLHRQAHGPQPGGPVRSEHWLRIEPWEVRLYPAFPLDSSTSRGGRPVFWVGPRHRPAPQPRDVPGEAVVQLLVALDTSDQPKVR